MDHPTQSPPPSFQEDGVAVERGFLPPTAVAALDEELDDLFKAPSINFTRGYMRLDPRTKAVPFPSILIRSVNLLEVVVDVVERIARTGYDVSALKLADLQVLSEVGSLDELLWHSDENPDGALAILLLKGGGPSSGGPLYMAGTHKDLGRRASHKLGPAEVEANRPLRREAFGAPGDLVFYNPNGLHSRAPCLEERRIIRITLSSRPHGTPGSNGMDDVYVRTSGITEKVAARLPDLFRPWSRPPAPSDEGNGFMYLFRFPRYVGTRELLGYFAENTADRLRRRLSGSGPKPRY